MSTRQLFFRLLFIVIMGVLLLAAVYWGVNAYLFTSGPNSNAVAVAASSAYGSLFLVGAIFIVVAQGFSQINSHLAHLSEAADEQTKLLRYIAKQNQKPN